jgi:hypothetical protein
MATIKKRCERGLLDKEIRLNSPNTTVIGDREAVGVSLREKAFATTFYPLVAFAATFYSNILPIFYNKGLI